MRVTTPEVNVTTRHTLVPERYIQPFPDKERRWVPASDYAIGVHPEEPGNVDKAVEALARMCERDKYFEEYRFVLITTATTRQVIA